MKDRTTFTVTRIDAIKNDDVKVHVQVEATAEALHDRDRSAFGCIDSQASCGRAMRREDGLHEHARDDREDVGMKRRQRAELDRPAEPARLAALPHEVRWLLKRP